MFYQLVFHCVEKLDSLWIVHLHLVWAVNLFYALLWHLAVIVSHWLHEIVRYADFKCEDMWSVGIVVTQCTLDVTAFSI